MNNSQMSQSEMDARSNQQDAEIARLTAERDELLAYKANLAISYAERDAAKAYVAKLVAKLKVMMARRSTLRSFKTPKVQAWYARSLAIVS